MPCSVFDLLASALFADDLLLSVGRRIERMSLGSGAQGYFLRTPLLRGRVRVFGDKAYITLMSQNGTLRRYEFEYEIPMDEAVEIMTRFSIEPTIAKTRHEVPYEGVL